MRAPEDRQFHSLVPGSHCGEGTTCSMASMRGRRTTCSSRDRKGRTALRDRALRTFLISAQGARRFDDLFGTPGVAQVGIASQSWSLLARPPSSRRCGTAASRWPRPTGSGIFLILLCPAVLSGVSAYGWHPPPSSDRARSRFDEVALRPADGMCPRPDGAGRWQIGRRTRVFGLEFEIAFGKGCGDEDWKSSGIRLGRPSCLLSSFPESACDPSGRLSCEAPLSVAASTVLLWPPRNVRARLVRAWVSAVWGVRFRRWREMPSCAVG
jgi:hypothetical protein